MFYSNTNPSLFLQIMARKCRNKFVKFQLVLHFNKPSVFLPSVSVGVQFQFIGTDNFISANIFIVCNNIIAVSCMYLTLFTCTLKGAFNCHQLLPLKYWHWQLCQMQYYILLAPTTISDTLLFQLIIAKLPSQKVVLVTLLEFTHTSCWIWWGPVASMGKITGRCLPPPYKSSAQVI